MSSVNTGSGLFDICWAALMPITNFVTQFPRHHEAAGPMCEAQALVLLVPAQAEAEQDEITQECPGKRRTPPGCLHPHEEGSGGGINHHGFTLSEIKISAADPSPDCRGHPYCFSCQFPCC